VQEIIRKAGRKMEFSFDDYYIGFVQLAEVLGSDRQEGTGVG
jgi:hypothetical protein